jgi:hypothetical protein
MAITNPSFEDAGTLPGEADGWTYSSASALAEGAEFDIAVGGSDSNKAVENCEAKWRNRFSPRDLSGNPAHAEDWGHYDYSGGFTGRGAVPGSGHLVGLVFVIDDTLATFPGDPVVTVTYNKPGGGSDSKATTLPDGAQAGREFQLLLNGDVGAEEITNISVAPALTSGALHVEGGLALSPYNDDGKFAFEEAIGVELHPAIISGANPIEVFEFGWDSDAGFKNDFDAIPSEAADIDGEPDETFDDTWILPRTGTTTPPWNESRRIAFHPFVVTGELAAETSVIADVNDAVRFEYTAGGTTSALSTTIAAGTYTPAQLAAAIETAIDTALDADGGSADNTSFDAYAVVGNVYLENQLAGSAMILLDPASDSFWELVDIEPGVETTRYVESDVLDASTFDSGTPEAFEDFEEEWRSNENSVFAWTVDPPAPPTSELDVATITVSPGTQNYEPFNTADWTLTL